MAGVHPLALAIVAAYLVIAQSGELSDHFRHDVAGLRHWSPDNLRIGIERLPVVSQRLGHGRQLGVIVPGQPAQMPVDALYDL